MLGTLTGPRGLVVVCGTGRRLPWGAVSASAERSSLDANTRDHQLTTPTVPFSCLPGAAQTLDARSRVLRCSGVGWASLWAAWLVTASYEYRWFDGITLTPLTLTLTLTSTGTGHLGSGVTCSRSRGKLKIMGLLSHLDYAYVLL